MVYPSACMDVLTETTLVADDLGVISGLRAFTGEVTEVAAVVAGDSYSGARLGTLARNVSLTVAVLADDGSRVVALVLAVAMEIFSELQTHLNIWHAYPISPQLKQAPVFFLGSGHSLDM